jgi:hypothetical protein
MGRLYIKGLDAPIPIPDDKVAMVEEAKTKGFPTVIKLPDGLGSWETSKIAGVLRDVESAVAAEKNLQFDEKLKQAEDLRKKAVNQPPEQKALECLPIFRLICWAIRGENKYTKAEEDKVIEKMTAFFREKGQFHLYPDFKVFDFLKDDIVPEQGSDEKLRMLSLKREMRLAALRIVENAMAKDNLIAKAEKNKQSIEKLSQPPKISQPKLTE